MKKQITIILFLLTRLVYGQVTLEHIYPNTYTPTSKAFMFVQLDTTTYKYVLFDFQNSQFTIYNLNHTVFLNVTIPLAYTIGSSQYTIAYVSKSLFDCDTSNIEYALSFLGDGNPTTYPKKFYVYRTNGTQLVNIDSCCFMNYSAGWTYGPLQNEPIVKTPLGSKLFLRCLDGSARVYSVCGNLPTCNLLTSNYNKDFFLGNSFPNPTNNIVSIPYSLPDNEKSGVITIFDTYGKEIKSFKIDNNFKNITLTTADLASGTYYYQLVTSSGHADTKKIIKVE